MKKKLLILLLTVTLLFTACSNNEKKQETQAPTQATVLSGDYFKSFVDEVNNNAESTYTAKFKTLSNTLLLTLKEGMEVTDVESIRNWIIELSTTAKNDLGNGYKIKLENNNKKTLFVAEDGEIKEDYFIAIELTEEAITQLINKHFGGPEITELAITENNIVIKFYKKDIFSVKSEVKSNARNTVDFLEEVYKNETLDNISITQQGKLIDQKGNESVSDIILFETNKATITDVNWDNFSNLVTSDYKNLGNIATNYKFNTAILDEIN